MKIFQDENEILKEEFILGTHFSYNQLSILTYEPQKNAYLIPIKFEDELEALDYYNRHLKEV